MVTRPASPPAVSSTTTKLRRTQAEYVASRPTEEPGVKQILSGSKMYVCRRCQANFRTGHGQPDKRLPGIGKCDPCLAAASTPSQLA
jgi:hypothetical protein